MLRIPWLPCECGLDGAATGFEAGIKENAAGSCETSLRLCVRKISKYRRRMLFGVEAHLAQLPFALIQSAKLLSHIVKGGAR